MRLFSLAFLLGILLLQQFSYLPETKWLWIITASAILLGWFRIFRLPIAIALGFAWCLWYVHTQMSWTLPDNFEGKTLTAEGSIASIPDSSQFLTSFLFSVKTLQLDNQKQPAHGLLRLTWRNNKTPLHIGDNWQVKIRLKKVHGTFNPGGFDYEAWALQDGIRANGYVVDREPSILISSDWYNNPINRAREFLKNKIEKNLPKSNTSPWITALILGERHGIGEENWEVLRKTGTNHLMAIAGLHIGFMSGFAYALVAWAWRRWSRMALKFPAPHAGAVAALCVALTYSAMAGFSLPTQRACIMLTVFLIILLMRRKIFAWQGWSIALFTVLLLNPLSVLTESFWLSFGAVALIIYGVSGRLAPKGFWWKWGGIQWVIALGLIPFSFWLFQQCSIVSFLANTIAIPTVGFIIVPLCLIGSFILFFSAKLGALVLMLADKVLSILWIVLTWFSHLSWAAWYQAVPNHWILIAACIGTVILLFPSGFPGRYLGLICLLSFLLYQTPTPKKGEVWLTLLDVGQGLSTVVQTQNHMLVFDTGAKFGLSYDMGESVVVPYLRSMGIKRIDMLVISHGDNDHIGGSKAVLNRLQVKQIKTSVPEKLPSANTSYCLRGERWQWDDVDFKFLYPSADNLHLGNDSSCVLRISTGDKHILLTGDIEKFAEKYLVNFELENLPANILIAPHHGSKTSGQTDFLQAVGPEYVLFPIGYRNRYRFPHVSVIEKYDALGVKKFDTAKAGAISFVMSANEKLSEPTLYRVSHHRYWNF